MALAIARDLKPRIRLCACDLGLRAAVTSVFLSRLRLCQCAPCIRDSLIELDHDCFLLRDRFDDSGDILDK